MAKIMPPPANPLTGSLHAWHPINAPNNVKSACKSVPLPQANHISGTPAESIELDSDRGKARTTVICSTQSKSKNIKLPQSQGKKQNDKISYYDTSLATRNDPELIVPTSRSRRLRPAFYADSEAYSILEAQAVTEVQRFAKNQGESRAGNGDEEAGAEPHEDSGMLLAQPAVHDRRDGTIRSEPDPSELSLETVAGSVDLGGLQQECDRSNSENLPHLVRDWTKAEISKVGNDLTDKLAQLDSIMRTFIGDLVGLKTNTVQSKSSIKTLSEDVARLETRLGRYDEAGLCLAQMPIAALRGLADQDEYCMTKLKNYVDAKKEYWAESLTIQLDAQAHQIADLEKQNADLERIIKSRFSDLIKKYWARHKDQVRAHVDDIVDSWSYEPRFVGLEKDVAALQRDKQPDTTEARVTELSLRLDSMKLDLDSQRQGSMHNSPTNALGNKDVQRVLDSLEQKIIRLEKDQDQATLEIQNLKTQLEEAQGPNFELLAIKDDVAMLQEDMQKISVQNPAASRVEMTLPSTRFLEPAKEVIDLADFRTPGPSSPEAMVPAKRARLSEHEGPPIRSIEDTEDIRIVAVPGSSKRRLLRSVLTSNLMRDDVVPSTEHASLRIRYDLSPSSDEDQDYQEESYDRKNDRTYSPSATPIPHRERIPTRAKRSSFMFYQGAPKQKGTFCSHPSAC
ncbi:hypothetical protein ACN47E_001603 [Coniothyrium glycines]